jgi:hypothetical protein
LKKYLKEIKEEVALCQKYIDECDIFASKSEHEKLALKIASDCEQTLSALADEIKKGGWISVEEAMPEEHDSIFAKFKGTDKWCNSFWEKNSNTVLVVLVNNHDEDNFVVGTGKTIGGEWTTEPMLLKDRMHVAYWMPFPKFEPKEVKDE